MVNRGEYNERMVYKIEAPETRKMKKQVLGLALRFGVLAGATGGGVGVLMDARIPMIAFVSLLAAAVCIGLLYANLMRGVKVMAGQGPLNTMNAHAPKNIAKNTSGHTSWVINPVK